MFSHKGISMKCYLVIIFKNLRDSGSKFQNLYEVTANLAVKTQYVSAFKAFLRANTVVSHRICPEEGLEG